MESLKLEFIKPRRREIINGKVYFMAGTSTEHGDIVNNLIFIFRNFLKGKRCRVYGENINVKFDEESREVLPDIKIVCNPSIIKKNGIEGTPDFIAEVLSTWTKTKDENEKKELYEKHGVKEYWIIDPKYKSIEVNLLKDGKFIKDYTYMKFDEEYIKETNEIGSDYDKERIKVTTVKTSLFGDDLIIDIADIFENID